MWGALIFLLFFLVIGPSTREVILAMIEQARLQIAVEAPLSYFLLVVLGGSALVSALIMKFWPRSVEQGQPMRVVRHYQGSAAVEMARTRRGRVTLLEFAWLVLPVRARAICVKLLRSATGLSRLKRLPNV